MIYINLHYQYFLQHIHQCVTFKIVIIIILQIWVLTPALADCVIFWPSTRPKILFQGNTPEGSDTFQRPVIERDRVGGLRLMIWDKVKVPLCHYSHAPEESNLWTAWQLFPLDDD